ncbi:MAG: hypothetical protein Q4C37_09745 [Bacteroidales bacterium]|nr:hypothetical protein [Bacteroidales bacterium]
MEKIKERSDFVADRAGAALSVAACTRINGSGGMPLLLSGRRAFPLELQPADIGYLSKSNLLTSKSNPRDY